MTLVSTTQLPSVRPPLHAAAGAHDAPPLTRRLAQALDHVGHGIVLLTAGAQVLHANRLALQALGAGGALRIEDQQLRAADLPTEHALADALDAAFQRGVRHLLTVGEGAHALTVAVLPIDLEGGGTVLLSLAQSGRSHNLAVQCYARQLGFTAAETGVLEALLEGRKPGEIARDKGVRLSTVRTQIGQLRHKSGADSIRQLLERVLTLPPMMALVQ